MSDATTEPDQATEQVLVGISFGDEFRAREFLTAVARLASQGHLRLLDAVFVGKDESGKTVVHETVDPQPGPSALSGAVWAGLFGLLLGGPVGWVVGAGVGAGTGAVAAKMIDHGVTDEWVAWFREAVDADTTTLVVLAEDLDPRALVDELGRFEGAKLVYANLRPLWLDRMREALGEDPPATDRDPDRDHDPDAPDQARHQDPDAPGRGAVDAGRNLDEVPEPNEPA
jgi:uncharacterized membrane protein